MRKGIIDVALRAAGITRHEGTSHSDDWYSHMGLEALRSRYAQLFQKSDHTTVATDKSGRNYVVTDFDQLVAVWRLDAVVDIFEIPNQMFEHMQKSLIEITPMPVLERA
jgi:hypothetical protein